MSLIISTHQCPQFDRLEVFNTVKSLYKLRYCQVICHTREINLQHLRSIYRRKIINHLFPFVLLSVIGFISFLQHILTDRDLSWVSKKKTRLFTGHPCECTSEGDDDSQISWLSDSLSDSILNSVCRTPFSYHYSSVVKSWYLSTPVPLKTQSVFLVCLLIHKH